MASAIVAIRRRQDASAPTAPDAPMFLSNEEGGLELDEHLEEAEIQAQKELTGIHRIRLIIWITLEEPASSPAARFISTAMMVVISLSIVSFIVGTEPVGGCDYDKSFLLANHTELLLPDASAPGQVVFVDPDGEVWSSAGQRICPHAAGLRLADTSESLLYIEATCVIIFTIELLLRLCTCTLVMPLRKFLMMPLNWVDLAAILPWYVAAITSAINSGDATDAKFLSVLRVLRLLRVVRVFKMGRNFAGMHLLLRTTVRSMSVFFILFMLVTTCSLLFGTLIHMTENGDFHDAESPHVGLVGHVCADPTTPCGQMMRPDYSPTPFSSIPIAMYWCMVTMSSVGYGDLFPITPLGYVIGSLTILAGMMTLALPITIISANFDDETREHNRQIELSRRRAAQRKRLLRKHTSSLSQNGVTSEATSAMRTEASASIASVGMPQSSHKRLAGKAAVTVAPAPISSGSAQRLAPSPSTGESGGRSAPGGTMCSHSIADISQRISTTPHRAPQGQPCMEESTSEKRRSRWSALSSAPTSRKLPDVSLFALREQLEEEAEELLKETMDSFRKDVNKIFYKLTPGFQTAMMRVAIQGGLHRKRPKALSGLEKDAPAKTQSPVGVSSGRSPAESSDALEVSVPHPFAKVAAPETTTLDENTPQLPPLGEEFANAGGGNAAAL